MQEQNKWLLGKRKVVNLSQKICADRDTDLGFEPQLCWGFPIPQKIVKNMIHESSQCLTSFILPWMTFFHLLMENEFIFQTNDDVHNLLMEKIIMRKVLKLLT